MNKKQRISKCLDEVRRSHCDWWPGIAADNKVALSDLEAKGYIRQKESKTSSGNPSYEITEEGGKFIEQNPAYLRPSLKEILHRRVGVVHHMGKRVMVFDDEPGQQYYFYYGGRCVGCGAYSADYEDFVKEYIDGKLGLIRAIDVPECPSAKATLEYRADEKGHIAKYLILTDPEEGLFQKQFYVGERRTSDESCIKRARYLISIVRRQKEMDEMADKNTEGTH